MYYDSIEAAIEAAPHCTHVLTTGPKWKGSKSDEGKYAPAYFANGYFYAKKNTTGTGGVRFEMSQEHWIVALERSQADVVCHMLDLAKKHTDQQLAAARFNPLDTQVGGDHYKQLTIQPIEFIEANNIPYLEGNAIKYIVRHASKNGVQDIDKAIHYLELLKQLRYHQTSDHTEKVTNPIDEAIAYIKAHPDGDHADHKALMAAKGRDVCSSLMFNSLRQAIKKGATD